MDDATGEWTKEHAIEFGEMQSNLVFRKDNGASKYKVTREGAVQSGHEIKVSNHRPPEAAIDQGGFQGYSFIRRGMVIDKDEVYCLLNRKAYEAFESLIVSADSISKMALSIDKDLRGILVPRLKAKAFVEAITGVPLSELEIERDGQVTIYSLAAPDVVVESLNLVGDESIPHTPGLVQGLQVRGFGVYNCDQTLRIEEPIALQPTYHDKEDGSVLKGLYVACVIDLGLNASLTYHPNHLVCNKKGNSKALVFTNDKEIYLVPTSAFKKEPLKDGPIDLEVENITDQIKSPSDLQNVLSI